MGATAVGACIDLYVISPFKCSLDLLKPLAGNTGGILYLYPHLDAASLPQVRLREDILVLFVFSTL